MAETRAQGGTARPVPGQNGQQRVEDAGNGRHVGTTNGRPLDADVSNLAPATPEFPQGAGQLRLRQAGQRRHDPRVDPPTKADRRRIWRWAAFLAFCPICLGVVVWAALGMNGSYPTVKPPVPPGWQSVPGIYASFSVPGGWSLKQFLSDASGDVYYSGAGGGVGESVTQADRAPKTAGRLPEIVGTFLGWKYHVGSIVETKIANATVAWRYQFHLANGRSSVGVLAWVKPTQSEVWLVASRDSGTTEKALSTLTLAS
jgi:hypothetical protein